MLGVSIHINGVVIYARTAVNSGPIDEKRYEGLGHHLYLCDDGSAVFHNPNDGAVVLAKKLLDTIKEQKSPAALAVSKTEKS